MQQNSNISKWIWMNNLAFFDNRRTYKRCSKCWPLKWMQSCNRWTNDCLDHSVTCQLIAASSLMTYCRTFYGVLGISGTLCSLEFSIREFNCVSAGERVGQIPQEIERQRQSVIQWLQSCSSFNGQQFEHLVNPFVGWNIQVDTSNIWLLLQIIVFCYNHNGILWQ
jgi:hypothetical protein